MKAGLGPACRGKVARDNAENEAPDAFLHDVGNFFKAGLVCRRVNGLACTNIKQTVVRHSPTGFEWGYAGSGPADLALNVLLHYLPPDKADRLHQKFKDDIISRIPRDGGVVVPSTVAGWIYSETLEALRG